MDKCNAPKLFLILVNIIKGEIRVECSNLMISNTLVGQPCWIHASVDGHLDLAMQITKFHAEFSFHNLLNTESVKYTTEIVANVINS